MQEGTFQATLFKNVKKKKRELKKTTFGLHVYLEMLFRKMSKKKKTISKGIKDGS